MNEMTSRGRDQEAGQLEHREEIIAVTPPPGRRPRRVTATVVMVVVLGAGAGAAWSAGTFHSHASSSANAAAAPQTYTVTRKNIAATTAENATLGYAGSYPVTGSGNGTLTGLPSAGRLIGPGQALYRIDDGIPVVLLYGSVPDWRAMYEGMTGQDVAQLNHDLVGMGLADRSEVVLLGWDFYSYETASGVRLLQQRLGVSYPSGNLPLGQVVFEPEALRVSQVTASLGSPASGPILTATSDRHIVTISLSTSMESEVTAGDAVTVTLPSGSTTPGVITSVGAVASGSSGSATVPVSVKLTDPSAAGSLDQAPVTVNITTASASDVLVVEVGALLAQPSGGYAVEVIGPDSFRRLVPVTVGLFDDASGLVQVSGNLTPGERVVVPSV